MDEENKGEGAPNSPPDSTTPTGSGAGSGNPETPSAGGEERIAEIEAKRRNEREGRLIAEKQLKEMRAEFEALKGKSQGSLKGNFATVDEVDEMFLRSSGHSEDEVRYIRTYAKGAGKRPKDVASDEVVKLTIEAMRLKAKAGQATPPPSGTVPAGTPASSTPASSEVKPEKAGSPEHHSRWDQALEKERRRRIGQESYT